MRSEPGNSPPSRRRRLIGVSLSGRIFLRPLVLDFDAPSHHRRVPGCIVIETRQRKPEHGQLVRVAGRFVSGCTALALRRTGIALYHHIPDRLAGVWIGLDAAVFLPGVEQAIVLAVAGNALLGRVFAQPGAHRVGQALGNKPYRAVMHPPGSAGTVQRQRGTAGQHGADGAHQ